MGIAVVARMPKDRQHELEFLFLLTFFGWLSSMALLLSLVSLSIAWHGIELLAVCVGRIFALDIWVNSYHNTTLLEGLVSSACSRFFIQRSFSTYAHSLPPAPAIRILQRGGQSRMGVVDC